MSAPQLGKWCTSTATANRNAAHQLERPARHACLPLHFLDLRGHRARVQPDCEGSQPGGSTRGPAAAEICRAPGRARAEGNKPACMHSRCSATKDNNAAHREAAQVDASLCLPARTCWSVSSSRLRPSSTMSHTPCVFLQASRKGGSSVTRIKGSRLCGLCGQATLPWAQGVTHSS